MIIPYTLWNGLVTAFRSPLAAFITIVLAVFVGMWLFFVVCDLGQQRKTRKLREQLEATQQEYQNLKSALCEELLANRKLQAENAALRTLVAEDVNHSKGFRTRAHAVLNGHGG